MSVFDYDLSEPTAPLLGLIVLRTDERIEVDFRRLLPRAPHLHVTRVASAAEVTRDSLQRMAGDLSRAAALLPASRAFDAVGYGCTSGSAQIGPDRIADLVRAGVDTRAVTEPVSALIAACRHLGLTRLAFLSPYVEPVSDRLRDVLGQSGIETPVFGSFNEATEARVVRIDKGSIVAASVALARGAAVDGLFLSCTNLNAVAVGAEISRATRLPVLSSNLVLAWHMCALAGVETALLGGPA